MKDDECLCGAKRDGVPDDRPLGAQLADHALSRRMTALAKLGLLMRCRHALRGRLERLLTRSGAARAETDGRGARGPERARGPGDRGRGRPLPLVLMHSGLTRRRGLGRRGGRL